jgi:tetratricopeptide (TPR) repeat protein
LRLEPAGPTPIDAAISLYLEGKREEALEKLDAALEAGTPDIDILVARSQLLYELERFEEALNAYEEIQRLAPDRSGYSFHRGVCLERLGRHPEALAAFSDALRRNPADGEARRGLGIAQLQLGRYADALNTFEQCLATSDDPAPLFGKAISLQSLGRAREAETIYRDFLGTQPDCDDALVNMIAMALEGRQEESVLRYSGLLLKSRADSSPALQTLAGIELSYENYEAAASLCARVVQHSPDCYEAWYNLGVSLHATQRFQEAVDAFRTALKLRPESVDAQLALGAAYQDAGSVPDALRAYQSVLRLQPENYVALLRLAIVDEISGNTATASARYADLVKRSPDSAEAWYRLGRIRFARNDHTGALECFDSCLKLRPDWRGAQYYLGVSAWKTGELDRAASLLEPLAGEVPEALHVLAQIALEQRDTRRAKDLYRRLLDSGQRSAESCYNLALLLQEEGQYVAAISLYQQAILKRPDLVEAIERLGQISLKLGHEEEARQYFLRARQKHTENT